MGKTKSVLLKTSGDFLKIELGRKNDKNWHHRLLWIELSLEVIFFNLDEAYLEKGRKGLGDIYSLCGHEIQGYLYFLLIIFVFLKFFCGGGPCEVELMLF
jgi:hypothetical protein